MVSLPKKRLQSSPRLVTKEAGAQKMAKYLKSKSNHRVAVLESEARHFQGQNVLISKK